MENSLINELINILEQENRIYENILRMSKNKTNIIVEGKVAELENIVKLEQALILQMSRLEDIREKTVQMLSRELNLPLAQMTVSTITRLLQGEQADKLKASQDRMMKTINELKNTNELNSGLIKNSLDYINFSINVMTNAGDGSNNYGNAGQAAVESKPRSLFDVKL